MGNGDRTQIIESKPALADRFEVLKVLGQGAAGIVYHALDRHRGGKAVALKILVNHGAFDENTLLRFQHEFRVCQAIRHPNLVEAYDSIEVEELIAYTMEYVEGRDLGSLLSQRSFAREDIDSMVTQLLSALDALHAHNIVHRDVKLENILLRADGAVKLSDLGLMKSPALQGLTRTGILLGTAQYLPPEYVRESQFDHRGDIYAAGIVLYELLTRQRRLADKQGPEALQYLIRTNFKLSRATLNNVPRTHLAILDRATASEPDARYQSAAEMRAELESPSVAPEGGSKPDPVVIRERLTLASVSPRRGASPKALVALLFFLLTTLAVIGTGLYLHAPGPAIYRGAVKGLKSEGKSHAFEIGKRGSTFTLKSELPECTSWYSIEAASEIVCGDYRIMIDSAGAERLEGRVLRGAKTGKAKVIPFALERVQ